MKQPKKPTLEQKKIMTANRLDWKHWNVVREEANRLMVQNKTSGRNRTLDK